MSHSFMVGAGRHDQRWRPHVTMAAAAVATLAVMLGSTILAHADLGGRPPLPQDPRDQLTALGRRALDELPLAYLAQGAVVVPAPTDPNIRWSGAIPVARMERPAVPLGARGVIDYARFGTSPDAPAWTRDLTGADRVLTDVGPLWFACTRSPGQEGCTASLLVFHDLHYYHYKSLHGSASVLDEGTPMEVSAFDAIYGTDLQQLLVVRVAGTGVRSVLLTMVDGSQVSTFSDPDLRAAGDTLWSASVSKPVDSVTAYAAAGDVIARVPLRG